MHLENLSVMTRGKNICNQLKSVRKRIAEENDIPLEVEECSYKGECCGTCPRCEAEVCYLENALADRLRLGKVATVAGLALGLATTTAQAQTPATTLPITPQDSDTAHQVEAKGVLKGRILDAKTDVPIPFCNVVVKQDGKQVHGGVTDYDGIYTIKPLPMGVYTVEIVFPGYRRFVRDGIRVKASGFTVLDVSMVSDTAQAGLESTKTPIIMCGGIGSAGYRPTREDIEKMPSPSYYESNPHSWSDPFIANPPLQVFWKEGVRVVVR